MHVEYISGNGFIVAFLDDESTLVYDKQSTDVAFYKDANLLYILSGSTIVAYNPVRSTADVIYKGLYNPSYLTFNKKTK